MLFFLTIILPNIALFLYRESRKNKSALLSKIQNLLASILCLSTYYTYVLYEAGMGNKYEIRIDLLFIWPMLILAAIVLLLNLVEFSKNKK